MFTALVTSGEDRVNLFLAGTVGDCEPTSSADAISPRVGGGGTDGGELLGPAGENFLGEAATIARLAAGALEFEYTRALTSG